MIYPENGTYPITTNKITRRKEMKHMKKIVSLLLTLVMALALAVPTVAATVSNPTGHAYKAYQIFKGTQEAGNAALGDVDWGSGIDYSNFLSALKDDSRFGEGDANIFSTCTSAADIAAVRADAVGRLCGVHGLWRDLCGAFALGVFLRA